MADSLQQLCVLCCLPLHAVLAHLQEFLQLMREENAFPVDPATVPPNIMQEIEAVMPIWNAHVDLRVKKKHARAAIELPGVEEKICGLVRRVLKPTGGGSKRATDLNAMYVVGMLLWADGVGGPYTQEQKKNKVRLNCGAFSELAAHAGHM